MPEREEEDRHGQVTEKKNRHGQIIGRFFW